MRRVWASLFLLVPAASGCGGDEPADDGTADPPPSAAACSDLEVRAADGKCARVGVPPEACADGFAPDEVGGCLAVLPAAPCAPGSMALPGESACRAVAPCADGRWGSIATDGSTQHVDAAYDGTDSDGSSDRPYKTIQQGIDAATSGGLVAVAAGSYQAVTIVSPVRVEGRCPELVEIAGAAAETPAVYVFGAPGTVVRGVAVTGTSYGVAVLDATEVTLDRLWIHDTGDRGLVMQDSYGAAAATLTDSLIEAATDLGILLAGSELTVERSVIRNMRPKTGAASFGYGVAALDNGATGGRSKLTMRASAVLEARSAGILVAGSDGEIEGTLVRDVLPGSGSAPAGFGIGVEINPISDAPASLVVRGSVVERALDAGLVAAGAPLTVEHVVVRAIGVGDVVGWRGGVVAQSVEGVRSMLDLSASTIEDVVANGIAVIGSDASVRGTLARRTVAVDDTARGVGVLVRDALDDAARATAIVQTSLLEDHPAAGVMVAGADATLEGVLVRASAAASAAAHGHGVVVHPSPESGARALATLAACAVERARGVGLLVIASDAEVADTTVADTAPRADDGLFGDGVAAVAAMQGAPALTLSRCRIERSARAGIASFGASVGLDGAELLCNATALVAAAGTGASFTGLGTSRCGCDAEVGACQPSEAALDAPVP
jgi:hypothetical protein